MAVIETNSSANRSVQAAALQALTAAALLLPGMQTAAAQSASGAEGPAVQVSRYAESARNTSIPTGLKPLQAYTLDFQNGFSIGDNQRWQLRLTQDTWSGATPVTTAPLLAGGNRPLPANVGSTAALSGASPVVNGTLLLDRSLTPVTALAAGTYARDARNEVVMSSASPEFRKQAELSLARTDTGREDSARISVSSEPDFHSLHLGAGSRFDFKRQNTSLAVGLGFTRSAIRAQLDRGLFPYLTHSAYANQLERRPGTALLKGQRNERRADLALTQVLGRTALLDVGASLTYSDGFMENPYKATTVVFVNPDAFAGGNPVATGDVRAFLEQRPDARRQLGIGARYVQHITPFAATLHVDYNYSRDDWDIDTHSIELQWLQPVGNWLLAPKFRWYTQEAARFYQPYLFSRQAYRAVARDTQGREIWTTANNPLQTYLRTSSGAWLDADGVEQDPALLDLQPQFVNFSPALLPEYFSSDHRLGAFGSLSAGLAVRRRFTNGLTFEAGLDYYQRASRLQAGGDGSGAHEDADYFTVNVALQFDWEGLTRQEQDSSTSSQSGSHPHGGSSLSPPAGVMFNHAPMAAGGFATAYRLGHMQGAVPMTMHMLDLTYARDDRWSFTLMPQFSTLRQNTSAAPLQSALHVHTAGGAAKGYVVNTLAAVTRQLTTPSAQHGTWQFTGALDLPSGNGALAVIPALGYTAAAGQWHWGAQLSGREVVNNDGADQDQASQIEMSGWVARSINPSLSTSLRATHARTQLRDANPLTAHDNSEQSALGLGLVLSLAGQEVALEWLEPLGGDAASGTLYASWHLAL